MNWIKIYALAVLCSFIGFLGACSDKKIEQTLPATPDKIIREPKQNQLKQKEILDLVSPQVTKIFSNKELEYCYKIASRAFGKDRFEDIFLYENEANKLYSFLKSKGVPLKRGDEFPKAYAYTSFEYSPSLLGIKGSNVSKISLEVSHKGVTGERYDEKKIFRDGAFIRASKVCYILDVKDALSNALVFDAGIVYADEDDRFFALLRTPTQEEVLADARSMLKDFIGERARYYNFVFGLSPIVVRNQEVNYELKPTLGKGVPPGFAVPVSQKKSGKIIVDLKPGGTTPVDLQRVKQGLKDQAKQLEQFKTKE